jgi:hypothetical protein
MKNKNNKPSQKMSMDGNEDKARFSMEVKIKMWQEWLIKVARVLNKCARFSCSLPFKQDWFVMDLWNTCSILFQLFLVLIHCLVQVIDDGVNGETTKLTGIRTFWETINYRLIGCGYVIFFLLALQN